VVNTIKPTKQPHFIVDLFRGHTNENNITPYTLVTIDTITGIGNTTGATSGAGTAYPSGTLKFVPFVYMLFMMSLHAFTNLVQCCDICCDFRMKTMVGSSLLPFVL
jgi:hypothetical protein